MSFPEQQEDKIITFALSPKDYYYELKLAKFLYKIDRIEGPTIEDLAVWCHNFAIGALSRQLDRVVESEDGTVTEITRLSADQSSVAAYDQDNDAN
jgi:hypothetical protein